MCVCVCVHLSVCVCSVLGPEILEDKDRLSRLNSKDKQPKIKRKPQDEKKLSLL